MTASSSSSSSRSSSSIGCYSRRRRGRDSLLNQDRPSCPHTSSLSSSRSNMADHYSVEQQCDRVIFTDSDSLVNSSDSSSLSSRLSNNSTKVPHSYQQKQHPHQSLTSVLKSLLLLVLVILVVNFPAAGKKKEVLFIIICLIIELVNLMVHRDGPEQNTGKDFMLRGL